MIIDSTIHSTLFLHNPIPNWVYDEESLQILDVNTSALNHYGYSRDEFLSMTIKQLRPESEIPKVIAAHKDISDKVGNIRFGVFTHRKKNGELISVEVHGYRLRYADRPCVLVTCIDVTERQLAEMQRSLLDAISGVFYQDAPMGNMLDKVCGEVAAFGNFSFVEIWLPDMRDQSLMLSSRQTNGAEGEAFYNRNVIGSFRRGIGLPGSVWMAKKTVIWDRLGENAHFLRAKNAHDAGIQSAIGVPLIHHDKIVGVLVIGSTQSRESLQGYAEILSKLEAFVGSEISRKRLELELSQLFHDLPDMVCLRALDGHWVRTNQACVNILGYSAEELASNEPNAFVHPDDRHIFARQVSRMIETGLPVQFEKRHISKSGQVIWLSWNCRYNSEYGVIYATAKNITEEKKLRELVETTTSMALIGSWELNLIEQDGDSMYWSPMVKRILELPSGYNPSLTGGFEFYSAESKERIKFAVEQLISDGTPFDEELLAITAKGNERWIRCIGSGQFVGNECVRIFGSYQDIHEKKSLELQVTEILESISDAFYAVNSSWEITYFNKEAENLLGVKSDEVRGKILWESFPAAVGTILETVYRRVASTGVSESFEYLYPADNHWYEIVAYASKGGLSAYFKDITDRKAYADELEKAYETNRRVLEGIGDAFFAVDRNFTVLYWNRVAEELLGVKREDIVGKNLWKLFPDAVNLPSYENYHSVLETGQPITFEDYYGVWLEVNAAPSEEGLTVFFRDITARKEADERLQKAFEERNNILESIGDAFFALDRNWIVTYWNHQAEAILGKARHEVMGQNLWVPYKDAVDTDFYRMYHKAMETGETVTFEEFYPTLEKWFEVSAYPSEKGLSVYFKDVTLRKIVDIQIREANERFEKVAEATTDAIWDWDLSNDIYYRGKGFDRLFGLDVSLGTRSLDFLIDSFHPDDLPALKQSVEEALSDPSVDRWQHEYRIIHKTEGVKTVIDKGVIIRDMNGKAIRMVGAITDITYRKLYEDELLKLNNSLQNHIRDLEIAYEELEQFTYIASHDLQEPLRMISSFMDQLKRRYGDRLDDKAHQYIFFAMDGAKRMKRIILDLLEYSRAGKFLDKRETVDVGEILADYQVLRRRIISEKLATITAEKLPVIMAYRTPMVQVFHSLLDNAIRYSRDGVLPEIEILAEDRGNHWLFTVRDNGIGIEEKFFSKIFVLFQRLHDRDAYEGTGIGLSIVKKHVESWGGTVWVESKVGEGSAFYFTIPK